MDKIQIEKRTKFLYEPLNIIRKRYENKVLNIKVKDLYDYLNIYDEKNETVKRNIIKRIIKRILGRK